jgi:hypothetical protein
MFLEGDFPGLCDFTDVICGVISVDLELLNLFARVSLLVSYSGSVRFPGSLTPLSTSSLSSANPGVDLTEETKLFLTTRGVEVSFGSDLFFLLRLRLGIVLIPSPAVVVVCTEVLLLRFLILAVVEVRYYGSREKDGLIIGSPRGCPTRSTRGGKMASLGSG